MVSGDHLVLTTDLTPAEPPVNGDVARIGCTLPEAITSLTASDDAHLSFIAQHADIVAVSFIPTADDVVHVLERVHGHDLLSLGGRRMVELPRAQRALSRAGVAAKSRAIASSTTGRTTA